MHPIALRYQVRWQGGDTPFLTSDGMKRLTENNMDKNYTVVHYGACPKCGQIGSLYDLIDEAHPCNLEYGWDKESQLHNNPDEKITARVVVGLLANRLEKNPEWCYHSENSLNEEWEYPYSFRVWHHLHEINEVPTNAEEVWRFNEYVGYYNAENETAILQTKDAGILSMSIKESLEFR